MKLLAFLVICLILVSNKPTLAQQISLDGNTNTTLTINGRTTDVTTSTIKGSNAFNSFGKFNVLTGNTVNLVVPSSATNLINIVHSGLTSINGVLNSLKDGALGGNVYLLNPNGIVIGSQGSINVGSLTMITPTTDYVNSFFDSPNNPNDNAVVALLNNNVPINSMGYISHSGTINSLENVSFSSNSLYSSGSITSGQPQALNATDIVNMGSSESAQTVVIDQGKIVLNALSNITLTGAQVISNQGSIDLVSKDVIINQNANISTVNNLNVTAYNNLTVVQSTIGAGNTLVTSATNNNSISNATTINAKNLELKGNNACITSGSAVNATGSVKLDGATSAYIDGSSKVTATEDVTLVSSAGNALISSAEVNARNVTLNGTTDSTIIGATVNASGIVKLNGINAVTINNASKVTAAQDVTLTSSAGSASVALAEVKAQNLLLNGKTDSTLSAATINTEGSTILQSAGKSIITDASKINTKGDIILTSSNESIISKGSQLNAGRNAYILSCNTANITEGSRVIANGSAVALGSKMVNISNSQLAAKNSTLLLSNYAIVLNDKANVIASKDLYMSAGKIILLRGNSLALAGRSASLYSGFVVSIEKGSRVISPRTIIRAPLVLHPYPSPTTSPSPSPSPTTSPSPTPTMYQMAAEVD